MSAAVKPVPQTSVPTNASTPSSDTHLVEQCLKGNEQAWATLIDKYKRLIYSIPVKYGMDRENAGDIFQAVCVELFCELSKIRKTESLKSWLITVTARKCLHWKQQKPAEVEFDESTEADVEIISTSASGLLEEVEREQRLRDAVATLPVRCRQMIHLLFYEHPPLPYAEVARRLGLATGSIGFIRGRCLDKLQKILVEMGFCRVEKLASLYFVDLFPPYRGEREWRAIYTDKEFPVIAAQLFCPTARNNLSRVAAINGLSRRSFRREPSC
jgi:RNA polymerase sigma factor (sigma-70 family)